MGGLFWWVRSRGKEPKWGGDDKVQTRADTGSPSSAGRVWMEKKVTVAEGEPEARAAGAWLTRLLLNIPDLARRGLSKHLKMDRQEDRKGRAW